MLEVDFFNFGASECLHHGWNCECSCFQRQVCCLMKWETIKLELSCIKDNEEIIGRSSEKCPQLFVFGGERLIIIPKVEDRSKGGIQCLVFTSRDLSREAFGSTSARYGLNHLILGC